MLFRNDKKDNRDATSNVVPLFPLRELIVFPHEVYPIFVGFQSLDRLLASDEDGVDLMRENDQFAQREQWHYVRRCIAIVFFVIAKKHLVDLESPALCGFGGLLIDQQWLLLLSNHFFRD